MSRFVFATGGTGGHIYPAIAIGTELQERGHEVHFLGQRDGVEERLAQEAGFPFTGVLTGKLDRQRPDPRALFTSLAGVTQAVGFVRRHRPAVMVGFGGFASFPGAAASLLTRTPLVLHEQNAYPGLVTRLFASRARLVIASQTAALRRLKARDSTVVPYPVREQRYGRSEARRLLGLPESGTLTLVMGGSQGSLALNKAVLEALRELRDIRPLVLHSTGEAHIEDVRVGSAGIANYVTRGFVDASLAWSAADLAITRAGYGTLSEAAFHGVPLIMVPLPTSAENHQLHNALEFERAGAGRVLEQKNLGNLPSIWRELLAEEARVEYARAAAALSPAGATGRFADKLERIAEGAGAVTAVPADQR